MTKKTNSLELAKWLAWSTFAAICLGYAAIWSLDYIFTFVPDGLYKIAPLLLVTITLGIFYYRQLTRLNNHLPIKEKTGLHTTNSRSIKVNSGSGTKEIFLSTVKSIFTTDNEQPQPKELLWWQYGSYVIYEDTVYEWLRKGWARQLMGEAHPFSCNWMVRQRFYTLSSQCIERAYHEALVDLVLTYSLWLKPPRQGVAGKLRVSPLGCVSKLKGKW